MLKEYLKQQNKRLGIKENDYDSDEEGQDQFGDNPANYNSNGKPVYGRIHSEVLPSPLAWACFKGHLKVVWLLLKAGLQPCDYDLFGNTVMH